MSASAIFDPDNLRFRAPLYTITEAAWYLGVKRGTFRNWAKGTGHRRPDGRLRHANPILTTVPGAKETGIPFVGLVEGNVAAAFNRAGVSMYRIRKALKVLEEEIGIEHALASRKLFHVGGRLIYDYAQREGDEELLAVVESGQRVFKPVIERYLVRISFADDGLADRLILPITDREVLVADPTRAFGQPIFIRGGARMIDVVNRFQGGDSIAAITRDFDLEREDVEDVLRTVVIDPTT